MGTKTETWHTNNDRKLYRTIHEKRDDGTQRIAVDRGERTLFGGKRAYTRVSETHIEIWV
jgi:hypothetical protein